MGNGIWIIMIVMIVLMFWLSSRSNKKRQAEEQRAAARKDREEAAKTAADSWCVPYLFQFGGVLNHAILVTVWKLSAVGAGDFSVNKVFQTICDLLITSHAILFKKYGDLYR